MKRTLLSLLKKIKNVLKIWRTRNLTVQGKITIFKTFRNFKSYSPSFS